MDAVLNVLSQNMSNEGPRPTSGAAVIALSIHEILCNVFGVDSGLGKDKAFRDSELLQCALVSRTFREPALRALWGHMSSPTPLWRLLAAPGTHSEWISQFDFFDAVRLSHSSVSLTAFNTRR